MEEKGLVLCDSDILIEVLDRNNQKIITALNSFGTENLCISSVSFSEIIFGSKNKQHQQLLESKLKTFLLINLTSFIDTTHQELILKYSLSHKLQMQDALIAATALTFDIPLYTLNAKDFKFIKGLKLI